MTPLSAGGTMERCSVISLSRQEATNWPGESSSPSFTSMVTAHFFVSSRLSMLMPLAMKEPAMASMICSGRPMPSKIPPMSPGPRRIDMGSFVGKTGSPALSPPESS